MLEYSTKDKGDGGIVISVCMPFIFATGVEFLMMQLSDYNFVSVANERNAFSLTPPKVKIIS